MTGAEAEGGRLTLHWSFLELADLRHWSSRQAIPTQGTKRTLRELAGSKARGGQHHCVKAPHSQQMETEAQPKWTRTGAHTVKQVYIEYLVGENVWYQNIPGSTHSSTRVGSR